ncbi:C-C motif chemokine 21-like [Odontesthes bonariensis]|uniref:C-C motif chemokine 21-like n=1 Tax=Odontesthes bonariensis TaxID=219752 RepID=UPI003F58E495
MASRVAALLLLGIICFMFAAAEVPLDCCLKVSQRRLQSKNIVSYSVQDAGKGCDISATVFVNKLGKSLCVVHPQGNPWVQNIINILDKKKQANQ